jgi:hypothetical protein
MLPPETKKPLEREAAGTDAAAAAVFPALLEKLLHPPKL